MRNNFGRRTQAVGWLAGLGWIASSGVLGKVAVASDLESRVAREIIVRFTRPPTDGDLAAARVALPDIVRWRPLRHVTRHDGTIHPLAYMRVAELAEPMAAQLALRLADMPSVANAEPNAIFQSSGSLDSLRAIAPVLCTQPNRRFEPNDPLYPDQWNMERIDAPEAWAITQGDPSVVVAVVDTGLDFDHEDLQGIAWRNPGEIPDNGIDDDQNGFVDDVVGWDFVYDDNWPEQWAPHGTTVTSVFGTRLDNVIGLAGLAPETAVMVLSIEFTNEHFIEANYYAVDMGADVLNYSQSGFHDYEEIRMATLYAWENGATVVASAGNARFGGAPAYPAGYPTVIGVSATTSNDTLWELSNYGEWYDVAAPGAIIPVCSSSPPYYRSASGTSLSAPHVAGLAALALSLYPSMPPAKVRDDVRLFADDLGEPGFDRIYGYGRINAARTVEAVQHGLRRPADVNVDDVVDVSDLLAVLAVWGTEGGLTDVNDDRIVSAFDLLSVIRSWGSCRGE